MIKNNFQFNHLKKVNNKQFTSKGMIDNEDFGESNSAEELRVVSKLLGMEEKNGINLKDQNG